MSGRRGGRVAASDPNVASGGGIVRRWAVANAVGEFLGLGGVALLALALFGGGAEASVADAVGRAVVLVCGGVIEGAIVGVAQWRALRRSLPAVTARAWVGATAAGAAAAWGLGMVPSTVVAIRQGAGGNAGATPASPEPPAALVYLAAAAMGAALGVVLASIQRRVLRRHVPHAGRWLPANAAAWAVGMPIIFAGIDLAVAAGRGIGAALVSAAALLAAGAIVGVIEGRALARLLRPGDDARAQLDAHAERPAHDRRARALPG